MTAIRKFVPADTPTDIWTELKLPNEDAKIRAIVNSGFRVELLSHTADVLGLSCAAVGNALGIAGTTLARRQKQGRFNREESDRIFRLIEMTNRATGLFEGDINSAVRWMQSSIPALGQKKPIDMIQTSADTLAVLKLITRLEFGVHS